MNNEHFPNYGIYENVITPDVVQFTALYSTVYADHEPYPSGVHVYITVQLLWVKDYAHFVPYIPDYINTDLCTLAYKTVE